MIHFFPIDTLPCAPGSEIVAFIEFQLSSLEAGKIMLAVGCPFVLEIMDLSSIQHKIGQMILI